MARRTFGQIRKLPSGRFQARYRKGDDWINASFTFDTRGEADTWLAGIQTEIARGRWSDPRQTDIVADIVDDYINSRTADASKPLSPETRRTYLDSLERTIEDAPLGQMIAVKVRVKDVRDWWEQTNRAQTVSQSKKAYRLLKAAFSRLVEDEAIDANPCRIKGAAVGLPARRRVATEAELEAVLWHLPARWHAMVHFAAWVGPRWGELRGLQRRDLSLDLGTIVIDDQLDNWGNRRSTKNDEEGVIHIPPHLLPILRTHLDEYVGPQPDALLFTGFRGGPLSISLFGKHWRAAQDQAGVPRIQVHDLRRTAGTWATEKGGASLATVMRRLRHRTVAAAMGYQHPDSASDRAVAERLSAAAAPRGA